jgi:hypothetical protein
MTIDWAEFNRCSKYIEGALEHNDVGQSIEDVKGAIERGDCEFWPGNDAAIVTEKFQGADGRTYVNFFLAGGDLDELTDMTPRIEAWAKQQGASRVLVYGRRGWERSFLKRAGYRPKWAILVKDI